MADERPHQGFILNVRITKFVFQSRHEHKTRSELYPAR